MSAKKKRRWPWLVLIVILAGGAVLLTRKGGDGNAAALEKGLVVSVERGELDMEILDVGRIEVREKVDIKSKVAGQVEKVNVTEGATVESGQVLIELDATDYRREVERCEAELWRSRTQASYAKLVLGRKTTGVDDNVIPKQELDEARHSMEQAVISVRLAEVSLNAALDRLHSTKILSPIHGTILARNIAPGEVVTPGIQSTFDGKPLLTVADTTTLIVKIELNQIDVARVSMGQAVTLVVDAIRDKTYQAKITKIPPASSRPVGRDMDVFLVEAEVVGGDEKLKPGMTADVRIVLDRKQAVLTLPLEAIVDEGQKHLVKRVHAGPDGKQTTEKVEVQLGTRNDRRVELVGGVAEGDRILVDPAPVGENEAKL